MDITTMELAEYVRNKGISLEHMSAATGISANRLRRSLEKRSRSLPANEYLAICDFLKKDPHDFMV